MAHYDKAAQPQQRRDVLTDTLALKKALLGAVLTALAAMPRTFPPPSAGFTLPGRGFFEAMRR